MTTCSNPSRPKRAIVRRVAVGAIAVGLALAPVLVASPASAASFSSGNVVVCRVGTGTGSLVNTGNPVFLDEFTPAGTLVQSIAMPTTASGANKPLIASGTASSECLLTRSADGRYLIVTGYGTTVGGAVSLAGTTSGAVNRVIGRVDAAGTVDTTTALTDALSGNNPRSAVSTNGTDLWIAGAGGAADGPRYTTLGSTVSTLVSNTFQNLRQILIADNQLYTSSGSSTLRLGTIGTGLPTTSGQTITGLPGIPTTGTSPYGFFLADLSAVVPGLDTLYVADDTNSSGGILKYSLVGTNWVSNNTLGAGADAYRGLTGTVNGTTVTLFATRKGGGGATGGGELVSLTDTAGYNVANNGTIALRATAATNTAFRGVAPAPVIVPDSVVPEVPVAVVLPVSMLLVTGGFLLTRRRPNLRVGA